ncbi:ABC transporter ATP-binding protein [Lewinella sp. W8]|uniref:ABC transporter ATP-binding protein n=1 Tax=Lewinella sp. W8 TaxID=2528208 RepID=UPI0010672567|nr:ATP-binding cassette domain-containing protein [Lewinella sp. W8]MTB51009.1 ATP-binding cassette domain-containing protein [Lewinella sp. W8]
MLATRALTYQYPGGEQLTFPDISCARGETWLLLGDSGSGKTTLLQLLAGLRTPGSGEVVVDNQVLGQLSGSDLDRFRGKQLGIIFQTAHFVRSVSVAENLALAQRLAGNAVDHDRIQQLLDQLSIGNKADAAPAALSVGQQQRAAIARAIINQPSVILADEPTSALDDANTHRVIDLLREQAAAVNATLLIVTHDNRLTRIIDQQIRL